MWIFVELLYSATRPKADGNKKTASGTLKKRNAEAVRRAISLPLFLKK